MEQYWLDICLIIPLAWGLVRGLYKGLMMSVGSLVGLILGVYLANIYAPQLSAVLLKQFVLSQQVAHVLAYFLIFGGVTLISFLIAKILDKFFKVVMLSWLNRLLGALFGVVKYALALSVILNLIALLDNNNLSIIPQDAKNNSILYEPVLKTVPTLLPYVKFYVGGDGQN